MSKWIEIKKPGNYEEIGKQFQISPVLARIIRNRGINTVQEYEKYFGGDYKDLYSPHLMKDMDKAISILVQKIEERRHIRIIGDYDIDGVQSTYILYKGLKRVGAVVSYAIPHRVDDGYGINIKLIDKAIEDECDTILTCDNGISAIEPIAYAKEKGLTVVVTDHHEVPYEEVGGIKRYKESNADVIVNPKQADCPYPYKGLCGAAVAYKVVQALYEALDIPEVESKAFIENAGFATIGDVMDLTDENRILVKLGLQMLRVTQNIGMRSLIDINKLSYPDINSYHVGFILGPCLNATGRLDTAKKALELLLAETEEEANSLATVLFDFNAERKEMTQKGLEEAIEQIENSEIKNDKVLVVYLDCHESIAGIIAGKIRERYYKPVFVVTDGEVDAKGSGRSIEGYSMYDEMVKCGDLFLKFGGHPMAAGFSIKKENIDLLRKELNQKTILTEEDLTEKVKIDVVMPISYATKDLINQLKLLEPCGKANTKPVFAARNIQINGIKIVGKNRNAVKLMLMPENGIPMTGMYFGDCDAFIKRLEEKYGKETVTLLQRNSGMANMNILYYPDLNEWNGRETVQVIIKDFC